CATRPQPPCRGSAGSSASALRPWGSRSSARPATSPTFTPPTGSTARRSPSPLPSCCSLNRNVVMAGRYFDEWRVGEKIDHAVTRTVTETDNLLFSVLTHNPQPLHIDREVAAQSEFGQPLVNSVFTFGLMIGVSVTDTTLGTLVANLGYD